jgi:hypothetical protein
MVEAHKLSKVLHFFPGQKAIIWAVNGVVKFRAEAWGEQAPISGANYGIMRPRQTTPGKYVIHSAAPYHTKTWPFSHIQWGTPIKLSSDLAHVVYQTGNHTNPWKNVDIDIPGLTPEVIKSSYNQLYGEWKIPGRWVFNDFGVKAVRYFKDDNNNKKLDKGEFLSGEMFHTTPENEAETALGRNVNLESSHGYIHLKPMDRDRFEKEGAFNP